MSGNVEPAVLLDKMAATKAKLTSKVEDTNVTFEDQQCINIFARKNGRLQEIKGDIAEKKKNLQNIEDASDELLMLEDDGLIPYPYQWNNIKQLKLDRTLYLVHYNHQAPVDERWLALSTR
ncbi:hypothetical protein QZH41_017811 [Actinostola sp. cb2023]|nr:hypothetical protein QZH41_017811 [Actinostola sp. cb2023]